MGDKSIKGINQIKKSKMSYEFVTARRQPRELSRVVFFWDGSYTKSKSVATAVSMPRGRNSTVLVANVYTLYGTPEREYVLGTAIFKLSDIASHSGGTLSSDVKRHSNSSSSGTLTLKNIPGVYGGSIPEDSDLTRYAKAGGHPVYKSVEAHQMWWRGKKYARSELSNFRMPIWMFGRNYAVPGWNFATYQPISPPTQLVMAHTLNIALMRTGGTVGDIINRTPSGLATLAWYHCVYSHSIPYTLEEDTRKPGKPAEYFSPPGLRGTGDCEDVSWAIITSARELQEVKIGSHPKFNALKVLQRLNSAYHPFMILGSATDASPDNNASSGSIMAHMYALMIPNTQLVDDFSRLGIPVRGEIEPSLPVLLVEGTGTVWPLQQKGMEPTFHTPLGRKFSNSVIRDNRLMGVRRVIFSPATAENEYRVAEFYLEVVSGVSPYPEVGMFAFTEPDTGRIGPKLADILSFNDVPPFRMERINGTNQRDPRWAEDVKLARNVLSLHEPTEPRYLSSIDLPRGRLLRNLSELIPGTTPKSLLQIGTLETHETTEKTRFFFSSQDVKNDIVDKFMEALQKMNKEIVHISVQEQKISDVGSFMIDIYFKS